MPSYPYTWKTSDFSMEIGETVTITLNWKNIDQSIPIFEDGVQIGTTTTSTYEYTPTSNGTHTLHYFNTIDCKPLIVTVTDNDTSTLNGALAELGETIADNLITMGVTDVDANDGLTTLARKILDIEQSGSEQEIVSFDNLTTEFNYTHKRGSDGFSVTIPSDFTSLGNYCFYYCQGLTSVTIPSSVTNLGMYCFYGCTGLTSITIPSSVTSLGYCCFYGCSSLTSITIPSSVTSLGGSCFYACSRLTSITIPSSVTSFGTSCFYACSGLTSITLPNNITSLPSECFFACSGLTSITIPSSVTRLNGKCFYACIGLTSITIPSSVTTLGNECFYGCTGLTSVTIPSSVTSLGNNCFQYCHNLMDYQLYWETPPVTWNYNLMPYNTNTYFTIPNGTTANYVAKNFPSDKLVERSE